MTHASPKVAGSEGLRPFIDPGSRDDEGFDLAGAAGSGDGARGPPRVAEGSAEKVVQEGTGKTAYGDPVACVVGRAG